MENMEKHFYFSTIKKVKKIKNTWETRGYFNFFNCCKFPCFPCFPLFKYLCFPLFSLFILSVDVSAQSVTNNVPAPAIDAPVFTEAEMLLWSCVSRLPSEPYTFTGDIVMRKAYGVELKRLKFKSTICWDPDFSFAEYEIYSEKNVLLETLRAERCGRVQTLTRTLGAARTPAPAPNVNDSIQGTDVTWLDAMMDFVWWTNPTPDGKEKIKGRNAEIIKVFPAWEMADCAYVRIWIDTDQFAVLQATQTDGRGRENKKMWVRSVQKIDGMWVVKDIEVETPGTGHRTKVTVEKMEKTARKTN